MDKTIVKFKVEKFKRNVTEKAKDVGNFCVDFAHKNPVVTVAIIGVAGKVAITTVKAVSRSRSIKAEAAMEAARALEVWDASVGIHYILKRPMSGSEAVKLAEMMSNGVKKIDALKELGLV